MEITVYERLVRSETEALQSKMTMAIDEGMKMIQTKQSELMGEIKCDPRKSGMSKRNIKLVLQISNKKESDGKIKQPKGPYKTFYMHSCGDKIYYSAKYYSAYINEILFRLCFI